MLVHTAALGAIVWMAGFALAADATQSSGKSESKPAEAIVEGLPIKEGLSIETGFVIIRGEYLPLPYVIGTREDELFINGRRIDTERLQTRHWGFGGGPYHEWRGSPGPAGAGSDPAGRESQGRPVGRGFYNYAAYVEQQLQHGGLLIVFDDQMATFLPNGFEINVLETLRADTQRKDKVLALVNLNARSIDSIRWGEFVDAFQPSDELAARVEKLKQERAVVRRPAVVQAPSLSHSIKYSITVIGIVLGVVAFGSLLNHRPNSHAPWREIDTAGDSVPMVIRNITFVAVLSFFDLACTLLKHDAPYFAEWNPLASQLLDSPLLLAGFKLTSLLVGCGILLALRRYRGAQLASWWLCLVCTILTFRWAIVDSLFLS